MAKRNAKKRQKYAEKHPKTYKGKKRGRKPVRANARYIPTTLSNGDTPIDLLRKCRNMLLQSGEKWADAQKERANVLFGSIQKSRRLTVFYAPYVPFFETPRSTRKQPSPNSMSGMTRLPHQL